jgi:hypothetical protein
MGDEIILEEIRVAKNGVADAERELARVLTELEVAPRADKTTISEALHNAFQKLSDARQHLGTLEPLIRGKDD